MKHLLVALCFAALAACSIFKLPAASPSTSGPVRAELRAAVLLAKDAWVVAGKACIAAQTQPGGMPAVCETDLIPAHDAILSAAYAVDAMDVAAVSAPAEAVCQLTDAATKIAALVPKLGPAAASLDGLATDALAMSKALGVCDLVLPPLSESLVGAEVVNPYADDAGGDK